ncbi:MAG: 50S ribosomal protein L13, partial [Candidatus Dormibacteraceae bacterium]
FKTWTPSGADLAQPGKWYLFDATGLTLGRLASDVAVILRGKHKPTFTPHQNLGDHVVVINAGKAVVTGKKLEQKAYTRYTGYPSGLRSRTLRRQLEIDPTQPLLHAVKGMLPRNRLAAEMLKRLRVYPGAEHRHQAQQPQPMENGE